MLIGYWKLIRPVNVVLTFVAIVVACWSAGATISDVWKIFLAAVSAAFVAAGGNAINDYFDVEIDRINKPHRPIPAGILSLKQAKYLWLITSSLGFLISLFLPLLSCGIVISAIGMLYWYSARWKGSILVGNFIVALMTGMTFLFGGSVVGDVERSSIPALFAFLTNFSRELVKDMEDVEGDRLHKARTLPVRYGFFPSQVLTTVTLVMVLLLSLKVVLSGMYSWLFTVGVVLANGVFGMSAVLLWRGDNTHRFRTVSILLKAGMVLGLLGIIGGMIHI